jgi:transposase
MVAWLVTKADKKTICEFLRIAWPTVGAIAQRVAADELDPARLSGLVDIGVDEISWKKHHHYLTLVSNHAAGKIVWGKARKDAETLNAFFDEVGEKQTETIEAVSMDLGPAFARSVWTRAPQATICFDPFSRGQAGHRGPGCGPPPGLILGQTVAGQDHREGLQGSPLGPAEKH